MLDLAKVAKRYRAGEEDVDALLEVTLTVAPGEMVALTGPSGSGKTTLLLIAAAAIRADSGRARFDGVDLASFDERRAAEYRLADVGVIAQNPRLMPRVSALENAATKLLLGGIALGQAREQAGGWLERVGMGARLQRVTEELSGGERQRVAIARALAGGPRLILADEPTANLDSERSREVVELLATLAHEQNTGVLLVTHDAEAAGAADVVLRLRDGRIEHTQGGQPRERHAQGMGSP
jgi:putative ABC transport system ATP-binding protein